LNEKLDFIPTAESTPAVIAPACASVSASAAYSEERPYEAVSALEARTSAPTDSTLVSVLGVPIDNVSMDEVLEKVEEWILEGGFHQIATANTDFLINSIVDDELEEVLSRCDMVLADGMPLVWTSILKGKRLKERVTGSDMVPKLAALSARQGYRIFMLGSTQQNLDRATAWMQKTYPGVNVAGTYSPAFGPLEDMDHEEILARIEEVSPDILLVAFGNPKQEKWLSMHRSRLHVPVCIGVGASFDFLAGAVKRAPAWMQHTGLEWFYRVAQEPSRLARRYFKNAMGLAVHLPLELVTVAAQVKQYSLPQLTVEDTGCVRIMRVTGNFTGPLTKRFAEETQIALASGANIILDLTGSTYVGSDALGLLIRIAARFRYCRRELWLTGLRPLVIRALRTSRSGAAIRTAPKVADALRRITQSAATPGTIEFSRSFMVARMESRPVHSFRERGIARSRSARHSVLADHSVSLGASVSMGGSLERLAASGID
jgi:N-acetylglucosaminyldiphosphoundecaprenol N-acetyl-beta-D-mannosaminyltransferase